MSAEVLALIPAWGGSKGIPGKNLIDIAGRPLISWSIQQAQKARTVTRVLVSTDADDIAAVARDVGADVPFLRPAELAGDLSPDIDVFRHALDWLREEEDYRPDLVVHLRPTGPVRKVDHIDDAVQRLLDHPEADALRSVSLAHETPYKMWQFADDETIEPVARLADLPDCQSQPRQKLPLVYWQNGYVDVLRPWAVEEKNSMCGDVVIPFIVETPTYELDYPDDIETVEQAMRDLEAGRELTTLDHGRLPV